LPIDREDTLKKAEKLLRQGRLDAAIAEYVRVVDDNPRDWNTANTLGDLLVRAGQLENAAAQYTRIAEHFVEDGFYPKAAALFKKILKFKPDDEKVQLELADISARQGLYADAKANLASVAARRRARGDRAGADAIVIRLGSLDPNDFEARANAARVLAESGDAAAAAARYRALADDLFERNREADALAALKQAVRLNPGDVAGRTQLARAFLGMGDVAGAREFLDAETAADDPGLLIALAEVALREGRLDDARPAVTRALELDGSLTAEVIAIGWAFCQSNPPAAFLCIDAASDAALAQADYQTAASILQEYVARATQQVPALLKLVEVCVDGGLEAAMYETQAQLCDAYLAAGQPAEARVIAEDLVAREPWEGTHIERFRQALVMLKVPEPDTVIAERLNGQVPFVATDRFVGHEAAPMPLLPPEDEATDAAPEEAPVASAAEQVKPPTPDAPAAPRTGSGTAWSDDEVDLEALQAMLREVEGGADITTQSVEVDLTAALLGADPPASDPSPPARTLDDVFSRARSEAGGAPDAEAAAEQLRLGKTCVETGLIDEGIRALEQAARSPRHRFEAAATLARVYRQRNQLAPAIDWMERAAEAPAPSAEDGCALLYELGVTLEQSGENARALAVFLELLADTGSYRDTQARVARLSRVETGS
jgi:tetratricopeptide (TPR) repeat protein